MSLLERAVLSILIIVTSERWRSANGWTMPPTPLAQRLTKFTLSGGHRSSQTRHLTDRGVERLLRRCTVSSSPVPIIWEEISSIRASRLHAVSLIHEDDINDPLVESSEPIDGNINRTVDLTTKFRSQVATALQSDKLKSFTLVALSKKRTPEDSASMRGCLRMVTGRPIVLSTSSRRRSAVVIQVTFKYHGATDICKNWEIADCANNLEWILTSDSQSVDDRVKNILPISEWGIVPEFLAGYPHGIHRATMQTTDGMEWDLSLSRAAEANHTIGHKGASTKLSRRSIAPPQSTPPTQQRLQHDRTKQGPVNISSPVWQALGVTSATKSSANGAATVTTKPKMTSKIRQCQKFVEIVHQRITECQWDNDNTAVSAPTKLEHISVVDMGCGRGYLTFALHSFLYTFYQGENVTVASRGIDVRPKLVKEISNVAASLGPEFENLHFETGTIDSFLAESFDHESEPSATKKYPFAEGGTKSASTLDVLIALHACDTATDDALWSGISRQVNVIVVAPCCHQQIRPQLNAAASVAARQEHPYMDVLRHNIYRERMAETVTDSLRALLLELSGQYTVQVFEFIGGEHTSKNVMITAVRNRKQPQHPSLEYDPTSKAGKLYTERLRRIRSLAQLHGIRKQKLAEWMGVRLIDNENDPTYDSRSGKPLSPSRMPPLIKT